MEAIDTASGDLHSASSLHREGRDLQIWLGLGQRRADEVRERRFNPHVGNGSVDRGARSGLGKAELVRWWMSTNRVQRQPGTLQRP